MNILVTGANGFIGANLVERMEHVEGCTVLQCTRADSAGLLTEKLSQADFVFHLAGVNRPKSDDAFTVDNIDLTNQICEILQKSNNLIPIVFSSSTQATMDNPYGLSKQAAEKILVEYAEKNNVGVAIYRLPGVYGKWCRPNYNSVVATFCYNIAHDLPITISDPKSSIDLAYIDDLIEHFLEKLNTLPSHSEVQSLTITPTHTITLGALAEQIRVFRQGRETVYAPGFSEPFVHKLYATYLSYLDNQSLSYRLEKKTDPRGSLAEFIKLPAFGQIFVSRTVPGITRGNHYHHTKTEKFLVLEGKAIVRFRHLRTGEIIKYPVRGEDYEVVDIPPGYTHSIENVGDRELVTLFWASEVFDPERPDTYYVPVLQADGGPIS